SRRTGNRRRAPYVPEHDRDALSSGSRTTNPSNGMEEMNEVNPNRENYPAPVPPPPQPVQPVLPAAPPVAYTTTTWAPKAKSEALAGLLSLFPGLGHVYLGLYPRGVVFFGVWVLFIMAANRQGLPFGLLIPFWVVFGLIDAVRQAQAINASGAAATSAAAPALPFPARGALAGGVTSHLSR